MPKSPHVINLPYFEDSQAYFNCLRQHGGCVWLDSGPRSSQFDVLSAEPIAHFSNVNVDFLKKTLSELQLDQKLAGLEALPFTGGLIGHINYEDQHESFGQSKPTASPATNNWQLYDWALVQDHKQRTCTAIFLASCSQSDIDRRLELFSQAKASDADVSRNFKSTDFQADISRAEYSTGFRKIRDYILAGDVYQVNFAQRFSAKISGDISDAYSHLRKRLSGGYSAFLNIGNSHILSFSPEQFIQIQNGIAQSKPIKGTIKRGISREEDLALARKLLKSDKNRAENLMIVDLLRNDFSKNCTPHSVKVPSLFELESYANVHHLVSTVCGELSADVEPLNFFMDCFPGGSITGAPKKRAIEIITELETHAREVYCGSIVCMSTNGNLDSSITIRTLLERNGDIYCWGGGGIVADSSEEEEYRESIQKVEILMKALSEQESGCDNLDY